MSRKRYNNGEVNIWVKDGERVPEGFVPGMKPRTPEQLARTAEKRKQTNLERYGVEYVFQADSVRDKIRQTNQERYGVENPSQAEEVKRRKKQTLLENYGVENPAQAESVQDKIRQTNQERYGVEYVFQADSVKDKIRQTNIERYGVEHPLQSPEIRERVRQTNLERYGVEHPLQFEEIREKARLTFLENYGVENPAQAESVQDKIRQTNLARYGVEYYLQSSEASAAVRRVFEERYGVENPAQLAEIQDKIRQTNLERYGVEHVFQSEEVKAKIRQTSQERYGVDYPVQSEEVKAKIRQTNQERYGEDCPLKSSDVMSRIRQTNLQRYGVENPFQSDEVKAKIRQTCMEHYGVEHHMKSEEMQERVRQTNLERYGVEYTLQAEFVKERSHQTNLQRYGVEYACQRPEAKIASNNSVPNKKFSEVLDREGIEYLREFPLKRFSYDFKIGDILVEINPTITHNILWIPFGDHTPYVDLTYHKRKMEVAREAGFRCIHVFDWDEISKILQLLKQRPKVYARKCEICEVSVKECDEFLNLYHLQNTCKGQEVRLGLYEADTLISVMTFGKPRYNRNFQWELLRYCSIKSITGGAERIFRHFVQDFNPESVISYCDYSKFQGRVYKKLGFELKDEDVEPSRHWHYVGSVKYDSGLRLHITDNLLRQRGFDQLFHTSYGKGTSNEELMIAEGYLPVYDCGQGVYIWKRS